MTMSPDLAQFRTRVRAFLSGHAASHGWLPDVATRRESFRPYANETGSEAAILRRAAECQGLLFDAGLAGLTWPAEYGGQGLSRREQIIFNEELGQFELPLWPYTITFGMCGPTVLSAGTEAQKHRYLPPMLLGEEIWCQLFSESEAGSDVASLQTAARQHADGGWVINGRKLWTSGAHYARFGLLLARTNREAAKHAGLTLFVLDMEAPGVDVRTVLQMNGAAGFNEVLLDDVHLPADAVVGLVDDGWRVSLVTLMNERVALGTAPRSSEIPSAAALAATALERGLGGDRAIRDAIADIYVRECALTLVAKRIASSVLAGRTPGPEGSIAKLATTELSNRSARLGAQVAGLAGQAWREDDLDGDYYSRVLLTVPGLSIAGGTDQIMRNIIGERVLGLPKGG